MTQDDQALALCTCCERRQWVYIVSLTGEQLEDTPEEEIVYLCEPCERQRRHPLH